MAFIPSVIPAVAMPGGIVKAYFDDGKVCLYDVKPLMNWGGLFQKLKDDTFFSHVTVMNHTIAWPLSDEFDPSNCLDIDPCEVYESTPCLE